MTEPEPLEFVGENEVRLGKRRLLHFSGCDYFRLARHPRLAAAARESLRTNGLNVAASRRTTGNREIYARLEAELAGFFGAEAALLLPDGYLAPMAVAQALAGRFTHAVIDELAHGALVDAARMLDCPIEPFAHRDPAGVARVLARCGRAARPVLLTDGMFAHDGTAAPLREYLKLLPPRGRILVDDCHGAGVLGATGRGTLEHEGVGRRRILQCATLSKAFGAYGGVVLGSHSLRQKLLATSRCFIGTTPIPPPLAGAALASAGILRNEPERRARLFRNLNWVRARLRTAGWDIGDPPGPIIRLPAVREREAAALKRQLLKAGIYPPFLQYSNATARGTFRFVIASEHTRPQLERLVSALAGFKARSS